MVDDDREDGSFWAELERAGECLPGIDLLQAGGKEDIAAADGDPDGGVVPVRASHIRATNGDYDEQTDCERKGDRQRSEGIGVVLHVDIDSFYCEVERMDEPGLRGKPLAVQQFNSGGFVAVSYEAKAAGVRKGDGVGAGGRSNIQSLKDSGAVSAEEARRRCPGLVVRPMRTERYREVSLAVQQLLRQWANGAEVEKASYDDFYLELRPDSPAVASHQLSSPGSCSVHFVGVSSVSDLPPRLQFAVRAAVSIQSAIRELGLSASVGVSHNKLLSRLLSPLNKPAAVTVIQPSAALPFLHSQRIRAIPGLQRKAGQGIVAALGIETVAGVAGFSEAQLRATIGAPHAELLLDLFRGSLRHAVKERGPPKSIIAERSCPPRSDRSAVSRILHMLSTNLAERLQTDAASFRRLPNRLTVGWRQGYGSGVRSRSTFFPATALSALVRSRNSNRTPTVPASVAQDISTAALSLLTALVPLPWQLSRVIVGATFSRTGVTPTGGEGEGLERFILRGGGEQDERHSVFALSNATRGETIDNGEEIDRHRHSVVDTSQDTSEICTGRDSEAGGDGEGGVCLGEVDVAEQRYILATIAREQRHNERPTATDAGNKRPSIGVSGASKRGRVGLFRGRNQLSIKELFQRASSQDGKIYANKNGAE